MAGLGRRRRVDRWIKSAMLPNQEGCRRDAATVSAAVVGGAARTTVARAMTRAAAAVAHTSRARVDAPCSMVRGQPATKRSRESRGPRRRLGAGSALPPPLCCCMRMAAPQCAFTWRAGAATERSSPAPRACAIVPRRGGGSSCCSVRTPRQARACAGAAASLAVRAVDDPLRVCSYNCTRRRRARVARARPCSTWRLPAHRRGRWRVTRGARSWQGAYRTTHTTAGLVMLIERGSWFRVR